MSKVKIKLSNGVSYSEKDVSMWVFAEPQRDGSIKMGYIFAPTYEEANMYAQKMELFPGTELVNIRDYLIHKLERDLQRENGTLDED